MLGSHGNFHPISSMRISVLAPALLLLSAAAPTPEAAWKADLADTNKHYAVEPHAILKIQDAAYLGEGNSASLIGKTGDANSYRWKPGVVPGAVVVASYKGGKAIISKGGKPVADPLADLQVDKDVDLQAFPTQVQAG